MANVAVRNANSHTRSPAFAGLDPWLFLSSSCLIIAGLMAIYSATNATGPHDVFKKQVMFFVLGLVPFALLWRIPPQIWQRASNFLWLLNVGFLGVVLLKGQSAKGAQRWIDIGPMQFQPSEMSKLLCVITLATFFYTRRNEIHKPTTLLMSFLHVAPSLLLIFKQPHLGATAVVFCTWFVLAIVAGTPWKHLAVALALIAVLGTTMSLQKYQMDRIKGFVVKDNQGSDYQTHQAALAFGAGGVFGRGYLKGEQKNNVPERHNDFIFAVVGEEGGLVVCCLVIAGYLATYGRMWLTMAQTEDLWGRLVLAGIITSLGFHTVINICMNLAIVPVVGLWLPFMSYGGTALWLCMAFLGLAHNIYRHDRDAIFS